MRWLKLLSIAVAGVVLPVVLVFGAYVFASGSIGEGGAVPPVPQHRVTETDDDDAEASPSVDADRSGQGGGEETRGRCDEPEHQNDPECISEAPSEAPPTEDPDNSGPGSGSDEPPDQDPDNSGPGSSNSGSGSGSGSGDD